MSLLPPCLGLLDANEASPSPSRASLYALYVTLLRAIIDHHNAGPLFDLWYTLLHEGTWPEVLRRYVAHKAAMERSMVPDGVKLVCALLGGGDADELHCDQHLVLLQFLCDEALDTECVRGLLEGRVWGCFGVCWGWRVFWGVLGLGGVL